MTITTDSATATAIKDAEIARDIRKIQERCRLVPPEDLRHVKIDGNDAPVAIHFVRPERLGETWINGVRHVTWPSLIASEGNLTMPANVYKRYRSGNLQKSHMPFVLDHTIEKLMKYLAEYSFYRDTCSYEDCFENRKGKFASLLQKKAQLLVLNRFYPPSFIPPRGDDRPVMALKQMCYTHRLLNDKRELWAQMRNRIATSAKGQSPEEQAHILDTGVDFMVQTIIRLAAEKARASHEPIPSAADVREAIAGFDFYTEIGGKS
jgi:hypothetical protein